MSDVTQTDKSQMTESAFVPPRHWIGPEELQPGYWANSETQEKRSQEFFEKPVEFIDRLDRSSEGGFARRDFLTIMGASMAMAGFACARKPVHKIIPYVVKPEEITPGVANWYASTSKECPCGCGILVKTREGRPIKLEGNPDHPVNRGALCSKGQASLLNLYDPDRLKGPIARSRADGSRKEILWNDADSAIGARLKAVAGGSGRVRVLSGDMSSPSTSRLVQEFLGAFSGGAHVQVDPLALDEVWEAQEESYGSAVIPHYHFDRSDLIVSLGADFLGTWNLPVEHASAWSKGRKVSTQANAAHAKISKLVCFESTFTITGASADVRYPVRPGDELKIALAVAHELIVKSKLGRFAGDGAVVAVLNEYRSEAIAQEIGLVGGAEVLKGLARELWSARGKSLVVGGGSHSKTKDALALQIVINLLNSTLENEGVTVDGTAMARSIGRKSGFGAFAQLTEEMAAGQIEVLILYRSNPIYYFGKALPRFESALKKVPLVIAIADREDETAQLADFVLPDHHYLENWGDASVRKGVYSIQQPAIAPMHSTRAFEDSLLAWVRGAGLRTPGSAARAADWHEYLQTNWRETFFKEHKTAGGFEQFWEGTLRAGVFKPLSDGVSASRSTVRSFKATSLKVIPKYSVTPMGLKLALYAKVSLFDGKYANNAWLQEVPDSVSSVTWDNYLNVGPQLAKSLNLAHDDIVEVTSGDISVQLPVHIQPGMHGSVVSAAVGYGRKAVGKVGDGAGVDVFPFVRVDGNRAVFSGHTVTLKKTGRFYKLAATQWHTATENRPIINDVTLTEFKKNRSAANHTDPHLRLETVPSMWEKHVYPGYRWGMAIDLQSCIGCGACVIGCQAENNIPVVGRDQVRNSRQMHWIKIDRYYSGTPENPEVVFQPMLCQHCENAPCETVCPVLATVHDDEGLNVQVYNRCVGTRYCQNNCPYKVRRFNFFDHWKAYEGTMNLAWNPDVTVRTRGIMEKCTFCTQRIRDVKDQAKDRGEKVRDGEILTACQQTCPTDAIVFGDINDPNSRVSRLQKQQEAYRVLEVLNTKPAISYLTRVRNKEGGTHEHGGKGV